MKSIKVYAKTLLLLLIALVSIEFALRVARDSKAASIPPLALGQQKSNHLIIISDSVFGPSTNDRTAAGQMLLKINEKSKAKLRVTEIFRRGLFSREASTQFRRIMKQDPAFAVVMMMGKSDLLVTDMQLRLEQFSMGWLGRLEISRIALIWLLELEEDSRRRKFSPQIYERDGAFTEAWKLYSTREPGAMVAFEEALRVHPDQERAAKALYGLYSFGKSHKRGLEFFAEIEGAAKDKEVYQLLRANLAYEMDAADGSVMPETLEKWKSAIASATSRRNAFISAMRLFKRAGNSSKFAETLISMTPEESDLFRLSSFNNQKAIFDLATASGSKVLFVDYPSNHHAISSRAYAEYKDVIEFLDTRQMIIDSTDPQALIGLYEDDIEHLTQAGAVKVGHLVAERFLKLTSENQRR